ncbi:Uncharacterised protein [Helicobacter muridarum]|uniref:Uncharacterized protein n=1 Tax=Helicobacter muridarum TaxID=216 RepID=A0A099TWT7_9HELI|nr:Uncharacterised protein [Helicobacter muridarum]
MVLNVLIYPKYFAGIIQDRGKEAADKINLDYFVSHITEITQSFFYLIYSNLGMFICMLLLCGFVLFFYSFRIKSLHQIIKQDLIAIYSICSFIWMFLVIFVAPFKTLRYIMPAFPIVLLCVPYLMYFLTNRHRLFAYILWTWCFAGIIAVFFYGNRIENMQSTLQQQISSLEERSIDSHIAVFMIHSANYALLVPYMHNGKYVFFNHCEKLQKSLSNSNHGFTALIGDKGACLEDIKNMRGIYDIQDFYGFEILYFH